MAATQVPYDPLLPGKNSVVRDIGEHSDKIASHLVLSGKTFHTDEQRAVEYLQHIIGGRQVTSINTTFGPPWVLEAGFQKKMEENWEGTYYLVDQIPIPRTADVVWCHAIFLITNALPAATKGELILKARNIFHGNRDRDRFSVRRDSSSSDLAVLRLFIYIRVIMDLRFSTADIKLHACRAVPPVETFMSGPQKNVAAAA